MNYDKLMPIVEEIQNNNAIIRNLETGSQEYIELDKLVKHIEKKML